MRTPRARRRAYGPLGMLLALALVISACGDADTTDDAPTDDTDAAEETTDDEADEPAAAGSCEDTVIRIGTNADSRNPNPLLVVDTDGFWRSDMMFDPLVMLDPETLEPGPGLAVEWDIAEDDVTYSFTIADNVNFHDGEHLTTADIEFTILSILDPDYLGPFQSEWQVLEGAPEVSDGTSDYPSGLEIIDDYNFTLTLSEPQAAFAANVLTDLKPVPKHLLEGEGPIAEDHPYTLAPVGYGPYKFDSWDQGNQFNMVANDDYWNGDVCIQRVEQVVIGDMNALVVAVETGDLDATIMPPPQELPRLDEIDGISVYPLPPERPEGIFFNLDADSVSDPLVRRAVAHAIDNETFVEQFMLGTTEVARSWITYAVWAYDEDIQSPGYDPDRAAELLAEAGYPDGEGLTIELAFNEGNIFREQYATYVQDQLGQLGVEVTISTAEWGTFIDTVFDLGYESNTQAARAGVPDPADIGEHYASTGAANYSAYSNPEVDRLLNEATLTSDIDERTAIYSQVQEILAEDLPFVPGYWRPNNLVVSDDFGGMEPSVLGAYHNLKDWTLDR